MKTPNFPSLLLACALIGTASSPAQIVAYEPFTYAPGINPSANTMNGGTGWTDTWLRSSDTGANTYLTVAGGLTYPTLTTTGGALGINIVNAEGILREFTPIEGNIEDIVGTPGRSWGSMLIRFNIVPADFEIKIFNPGDPAASAFQIRKDFGPEKSWVGPFPPSIFIRMAQTQPVEGFDAEVSYQLLTGQTYLFVWSFAATGANPTQFFINPGIGAVAPTPGVVNLEKIFVKPPDTNDYNFPTNPIGGFQYFATNGDVVIDEVRIGKTFQDVTPTSASALNGIQQFRVDKALAANGSQDAAEPATDGVSNLEKFAFNMIGAGPGQASGIAVPNVATLAPAGSAGLPLVSRDATGKLQITYIQRKASSNSGITYTVEFSNDLVAWAPNATATTSPVSIDSIFERVTVTDSVVPPGKRFARVKVIAP
ncbi:MAG: hypothetical protein EAZ42_09040 [Verrucomicrobia bacterium]|nr:MAG: hypothetical protein EAZ42_09040 [Verrucomicrobiota bacterium]